MSFREYQALGIPTLGHHQTVTKVDNTVVINRETVSLPTSYFLFDFEYLRILLLGCLDLLLKGGFDFQVCQKAGRNDF